MASMDFGSFDGTKCVISMLSVEHCLMAVQYPKSLKPNFDVAKSLRAKNRSLCIFTAVIQDALQLILHWPRMKPGSVSGISMTAGQQVRTLPQEVSVGRATHMLRTQNSARVAFAVFDRSVPCCVGGMPCWAWRFSFACSHCGRKGLLGKSLWCRTCGSIGILQHNFRCVW